MSDLISRQDAIDALNKKRIETMEKGQDVNLIWECLDVVNQVPSKQQWIPCSERLPSEDGRYLVCMNWNYCNTDVLNWANGWNCCRGCDGKINRKNEIDGTDIIAWMPLPQSWKGEKEEGEPIPHWRGQMDGCLPFQTEEKDEQIH